MIQTKKLQEWWTEDVDGGCIIFNLYRNTENLIVLLKRWRGDFRKGEYCQTYQQGFYLEELAQIELTQNQTMEEPMIQKLKTRNIILITVLILRQMQVPDLSEDYLLIDYPN